MILNQCVVTWKNVFAPNLSHIGPAISRLAKLSRYTGEAYGERPAAVCFANIPMLL